MFDWSTHLRPCKNDNGCMDGRSQINLRVAYGFLQTYVVNGGEKNTPKFNKEYLWNHWTNLDHVNTIWREISSSFLLLKMFEKIIYLCVFFLILKNTNLIKKSNFRLRKTCVSYQPCNIFIRLRNRELNHVLLNNFSNERKWKIQDGGLTPEVDTAKRLFSFPHLIATRFHWLYLCLWDRPSLWDM